MNVPLVDLRAQYTSIRNEIDSAIRDVIEQQQFVLGNNVEELEEKIARYVGTNYAVGVASGTDAILLSLKALGVGPGDEVITTSFSFFATADAIVNAGATPVFVDIDPRTFNLDPALIEPVITERTKAIVPVHLFGQCADMDPILEIAKKHNLRVIEDAAQAIGATYKKREASSTGDCGCISFFPAKNLGAYGDGGIVVTSDAQIAETVRMLRVHGSRKRYYHDRIGTNSRLDALQAAILLAKLPHLDEWNEKRRRNAAYYEEKLAGLDGVRTPYVAPENVSVHHVYTIRTRERDRVAQALDEAGIAWAIHYPVPLPLQKALDYLGYKQGDVPQSEQASREVLSIPMYPELTEQQMDEVISAISDTTQDSH